MHFYHHKFKSNISERRMRIETLEARDLLSACGVQCDLSVAATHRANSPYGEEETLLCVMEPDVFCYESPDDVTQFSSLLEATTESLWNVLEDSHAGVVSGDGVNSGSFPMLASSSEAYCDLVMQDETYSPDENEVFLLHSSPGAQRVIYLDFNGHVTSGTQWNTDYNNGLPITTPSYDLDGDSATFNESERQAIYEMWQRVAEDYAIFNVDVTTEEPEEGGLVYSGTSDNKWGIRVCIGGIYTDWLNKSAGGISYVKSFEVRSDTPCYVFTGSPVKNVKTLAECISHEAGHSVGLQHWGNTGNGASAGYYQGANGWAPIMGTSYYQEMTQWTDGWYIGDNSYKDDISVISEYLPLNDDDYPTWMDGVIRDNHHDITQAQELSITDFSDISTKYDGSVLPQNEDENVQWTLIRSCSLQGVSGKITQECDNDIFMFTVEPGLLDISVKSFGSWGNLDVSVTLMDEFFSVLTVSRPQDSLDALLQWNVTTDATYYLMVEGDGKILDGVTYYTKYGSLGHYTLTASLSQEVILQASPGTVSSTVLPAGVASEVLDLVVTNTGETDSGAFTLNVYAVSEAGVSYVRHYAQDTIYAGDSRSIRVMIPALDSGVYGIYWDLQAYGVSQNMVTELSAVFIGNVTASRKPYDLSPDGVINLADLALFANTYGKNLEELGDSPINSDFNGDGCVNLADLALFARQYRKKVVI